MINAEVQQVNKDMFMVRFSDPNESFENKPFTPIMGMEEVKRRLYFINRKYILEKMVAWLNQRKHANSLYYADVKLYLADFEALKYTSFKTVCQYIKNNNQNFVWLSPPQKSRFYNHYVTVIEPILNFCQEQ